MSAKLEIARRSSSAGALVTLSGTIDAEAADTLDLSGVEGVLAIDLEGVSRITSFGVREWIRLLAASGSRETYLLRCRPSFVSQLNMVEGFAARATTLSIFLPYVCESCDDEPELLLDLRDNWGVIENGEPPALACPACGAPTEFDESASSYFSYLRSKGKPRASAAGDRVIEGTDTVPGEAAFTIRKEVTEDLTVLWFDGVLEGRARFKRAVDGVEGTMLVMCDGLVRVAEANAAPFVELLQHPDAVTYVARLRPVILAGLPRELRATLVDRVVDFLVDADCERCDSGEVAVRGDLLRRKVAAGPGPCQRCGGRATPRVPSRHLAALRPYAAEGVPEPVTAFIDATTRTPAEDESFVESGAMPAVPAPSKYEVLRRIGAGGMAEVFLARQSGFANFSKRVVIKRLLPSVADNQEFVDMFLREARVAAHIDHPNVVQIFDLGKDGRYYFIAMEYVRGWDLRTVERTAQQVEVQMPIEVALRIAADVCSGLSAAHECRTETGEPLQIIHRDVSPHNVLLSSQGAVKLTDFGISKVSNASLNTKPGVLKGKIIYMAPEQIDDNLGAIDPRTDLFAVGLVLHQMLSGKATFRRDSDLHSLEAVLNAPIPDIRDTRPDAPPFLSAVLAKALQRDPAARFEDARAMQFALEDILIGLGRPSTSATVADWLRQLAEQSGIELSHGGGPDGGEANGLEDGTSALRRLVSRDDEESERGGEGADSLDDASLDADTDIITKNHSLVGKIEP